MITAQEAKELYTKFCQERDDREFADLWNAIRKRASEGHKSISDYGLYEATGASDISDRLSSQLDAKGFRIQRLCDRHGETVSIHWA